MFDETFLSVLGHEGVAPIVTWNAEEPNLAATWNSYIHRTRDNRLLVPVMGMHTAQENLKANNKVKMVVGSKGVKGKYGPGAGFLLEGTARIVHEGEELAAMKKRFDWANSLMEITVSNVIQEV